jgi:hypothetical protein
LYRATTLPGKLFVPHLKKNIKNKTNQILGCFYSVLPYVIIPLTVSHTCSSDGDPHPDDDWLIGVFIGTQTFSVPTRSY